MAKTTTIEPELSRPLQVDKISAGGIEETIKASGKERAALAERFGLLDLQKLEARVEVRPARGGVMFEATGHMEADVVQQCVVTLEPLPAHLTQEIDVLFTLPELLETGDARLPMEMNEEETEAIVGGVIDLGELVAQHLGAALDPYPRKPGAAFVEAEYGDATEANPFAKLTELKKMPKT